MPSRPFRKLAAPALLIGICTAGFIGLLFGAAIPLLVQGERRDTDARLSAQATNVDGWSNDWKQRYRDLRRSATGLSLDEKILSLVGPDGTPVKVSPGSIEDGRPFSLKPGEQATVVFGCGGFPDKTDGAVYQYHDVKLIRVEKTYSQDGEEDREAILETSPRATRRTFLRDLDSRVFQLGAVRFFVTWFGEDKIIFTTERTAC